MVDGIAGRGGQWPEHAGTWRSRRLDQQAQGRLGGGEVAGGPPSNWIMRGHVVHGDDDDDDDDDEDVVVVVVKDDERWWSKERTLHRWK